MSNKVSLKADPNRKSFWQFQSLKNTDRGPVAVFQHAVTRFGETQLSEEIAYPNRREYTLDELVDIRNAPMNPFKELKTEKDRIAHEKCRESVNLARAGLTANEFNRAVASLNVEKNERNAVVPSQSVRELRVA